MTMTTEDILRAAAGLESILERAFPTRSRYPPCEMSPEHKARKDVSTTIQIKHLKYELKQISVYLDEDTLSKREKAFRWLSDVGGMMRSSQFSLVSITDLGNLFRPEADVVIAFRKPEAPVR